MIDRQKGGIFCQLIRRTADQFRIQPIPVFFRNNPCVAGYKKRGGIGAFCNFRPEKEKWRLACDLGGIFRQEATMDAHAVFVPQVGFQQHVHPIQQMAQLLSRIIAEFTGKGLSASFTFIDKPVAFSIQAQTWRRGYCLLPVFLATGFQRCPQGGEQTCQQRTIELARCFPAFFDARRTATQYSIMQGYKVAGVQLFSVVAAFGINIAQNALQKLLAGRVRRTDFVGPVAQVAQGRSVLFQEFEGIFHRFAGGSAILEFDERTVVKKRLGGSGILHEGRAAALAAKAPAVGQVKIGQSGQQPLQQPGTVIEPVHIHAIQPGADAYQPPVRQQT